MAPETRSHIATQADPTMMTFQTMIQQMADTLTSTFRVEIRQLQTQIQTLDTKCDSVQLNLSHTNNVSSS